jgi:hypothetical protein
VILEISSAGWEEYRKEEHTGSLMVSGGNVMPSGGWVGGIAWKENLFVPVRKSL